MISIDLSRLSGGLQTHKRYTNFKDRALILDFPFGQHPPEQTRMFANIARKERKKKDARKTAINWD